MSRRHPRRNTKAGRFARLPLSVLGSVAVTTLAHSAFRVMVCLAAQFNGGNNGDLGMTPSQAKNNGISSKNTFYAALNELECRGLIERTYPASRTPPKPTKYALTWLPVDDTDYSRRTRTASHAYKLFDQPPQKRKARKAKLKAVR